MMSEAQDLILCGVLQNPARISEILDLNVAFFDGTQSRLFTLLIGYFEKRDRKNSMDFALAKNKLHRIPKTALTELLLDLIAEYESYEAVTDAEFRDALAEIVEDRKQNLLVTFTESIASSVVSKDYQEARIGLQDALTAIEDADIDVGPPVDIRSEQAIKDAKRSIEEARSGLNEKIQSFDVGFEFLTDCVSFRRKELTVFGGFSGDGKALREGTPICTPGGWIPIEELNVGDFVVGRNGKATKVLGVYDQSIRPIYRITFSDSTWIEADEDHLWSVQNNHDSKNGSWRTVTTKFLEENLTWGDGSKQSWRIPLCEPIDFSGKEALGIDPYILGVLLGDGSVDSCLVLTPGNDRVPRELARRVKPPFKLNLLKEQRGKTRRWSITQEGRRNELLDHLRGIGLDGKRAWEKFIPDLYLNADPESRLELLRGLVDSGGSVSRGGRPSCVFSSSSEKLSSGVAYLVRSLGGVARTRTKTEVFYAYKGKKKRGRPSVEVCFTMPPGVIPTKVWVDRYVSRKSKSHIRTISKIEFVGKHRAICIEVDSKDNLFVTKDFIVTHNTQVSKTLVYNANVRSKASVFWVSLEMTWEEMQTLFICAHAGTLDPKGIRWKELLEGKATDEEMALYYRALDDFQIDRHEDQVSVEGLPGRLEIWAPNKSPSFERYCDRMRSAKRDRGVDIGVLDYLELAMSSKSTGSYRLDLKNMIQSSKSLARELDIWHLVLHQISRPGRMNAEKRQPKHYIMPDLGESSGIERAGDSILWSFYDNDLRREKECLVGIAKARKGDVLIHGRHCYAEFAKCLVGELE